MNYNRFIPSLALALMPVLCRWSYQRCRQAVANPEC